MKNIKLLIIPGALATLTAVSGFLLSSNLVHADNDSSVSSINIQVNTSCTLKGGSSGTTPGGDTYTASIDPGTYEEIAGSKLVTLCNDSGGYSLYAIGYSGDTYDTSTNTKMLGEGSIGNINTGTSGTDSYWAMKLEAVTGTTPPTILNNFDNYHVVPESFTQIAGYTATTTQSTGSTVQTKYKINISSTQGTGIYTGKVKYTMVHPNNTYVGLYSITYNKNTTDTVTNMPTNIENEETNVGTITLSSNTPARDGYDFEGWCTVAVADGAACTGTSYPAGGVWTLDQSTGANSLTLYAMWSVSSINLYDAVASMSKGTQTLAQVRAAITASNSGVYEYNSSVFGTSSDAANTSKIYYYRGILDNTTGSYGSNGDNAAHPNTVVLSSASSKSGLTTDDTCWRIVRTTGSGGVKMIYQGKWTGSTCANATTAAQVVTRAFGLKGNSSLSAWYNNINRVGYTFNNDASIQDITTATSVDTVFGSNSSPSTNNARSNIKTYIEDTWYANNMTSFTSKLEASAGYCNDRTAFTDAAGTSPMSTIPPYATSDAAMYFGSYTRVANATSASVNRPSLTCPRSTVDLYRYVAGSTGVSNQLKYPAALLTADEAAFAGSGFYSSITPYHAKSYLRSGSNFWLLSPFYRASRGDAHGFRLYSSGNLDSYSVDSVRGVRPAISLTSGTTAVSGTGTATDPWIVNP